MIPSPVIAFVEGPAPNDLPALVNDTGSVTNTYTDDTAQAGHGYVYAVQAINDAGASGYSRPVSVTAPAGPYNLLAVGGRGKRFPQLDRAKRRYDHRLPDPERPHRHRPEGAGGRHR